MIRWRVQYEGERYNDFISKHFDILEMKYAITRFETYREYLREIESDD